MLSQQFPFLISLPPPTYVPIYVISSWNSFPTNLIQTQNPLNPTTQEATTGQLCLKVIWNLLILSWLSSLFCHCLVTNSCWPLLHLWTVDCQASIHWILQASVLEWVVISSRGSSQHRDWIFISMARHLYHWTTASLSRQLISFHSFAACF